MDHESALKSQACEKYLLGELSPELRDAFEEHYFSCAECATELRSAAELVGAAQMVLKEAPAANQMARPEPRRWARWLRPAIPVPVFATLLLLVGYQNLVTIPQLKNSVTSNVLPMFSLIAGNSRGEAVRQISARPNEPLGLYVDLPADPGYQTYQIRLQTPDGRTVDLRLLSYAEAEKTQVVVLNPGKVAGNYSLVILGQAKAEHGSALTELARIPFTIAF